MLNLQAAYASFFIDRIPTKNDMQQLVYCMATIEEIQRISCVAPGSLPHVLTKNMNINGFDFPKGSIFMANITKFLKDPAVFPEPTRFLPERFIDIDEDGKMNLKVGIPVRIYVMVDTFLRNIYIILK